MGDFITLDEISKSLDQEEPEDEMDQNETESSPPMPKLRKLPVQQRNEKEKNKESFWDSCQKNLKELVLLAVITLAVVNPWTVKYLMENIPDVVDTISGSDPIMDFKILNWKGGLIQMGVILAGFILLKVLNYYELI